MYVSTKIICNILEVFYIPAKLRVEALLNRTIIIR